MRGSYILNDDVYAEIFSIVQTVYWISNVLAVVDVADGNVSQLLPTSFSVVVVVVVPPLLFFGFAYSSSVVSGVLC